MSLDKFDLTDLHLPKGPIITESQDGVSRKVLVSLHRAGVVRKLGPGLYSQDLVTPAQELIRKKFWRIVAYYFDEAIVSDRSALYEGLPIDGVVTVVSNTRLSPVVLPGLKVLPRKGSSAFFDDIPWLHGLTFASVPRTIVENLMLWNRDKNRKRSASPDELYDWLGKKINFANSMEISTFKSRSIEIASFMEVSSSNIEEFLDGVNSKLMRKSTKLGLGDLKLIDPYEKL